MEQAGDRFCTRCGCIAEDGATRCPECGAWLDGAAARAELERIRTLYGRQLRRACIIMLVYSVPVLMLGTVCLVSTDALADAVAGSSSLRYLLGESWDTAADAASGLRGMAPELVISGVCGLGCAVLVGLRRRFWIAMLLCSVSIIVGPSGILWLFLEFLAFWMIMSARYGFREYESATASGEPGAR